MIRFSVKRMVVAIGMCVAMLAGSMFNAELASGQGGDSGIVGTWMSSQPDNNGGQILSWVTFGQNGSYKLVVANRDGGAFSNALQRWGSYQARQVGQGQYQTTIRMTGGAPTKTCVQGNPCIPVQGIQQTVTYEFDLRNGRLLQGNAVLQRSQVPQQLQQVADTTYLAAPPAVQAQAPVVHPYTTPGTHPYTTPNGGPNHDATGGIKGINGNCDDAQQAQICHYGGGIYGRDRSTGCMVCQK